MRIVTLLPAATDIVAALGAAAQLVGISHECDHPPSVRRLPRVTTTSIDPGSPGWSIDADVRRLKDAGRPIVAVDAAELHRLKPDLIITQDLCEVCAVSDGELYALTATMRPAPRILALSARDLAGIWCDIRSVAIALDVEQRAKGLIEDLQLRLQRLRLQVGQSQPRVVCIEWLDPLYLAGHWVPDQVSAAGGLDVGGRSGSHSALHQWHDLAALRPDHVLIMLCGFGIDRARMELERLDQPEALSLLRQVPTWLLDGNRYTSRPGPRVVDGAEQISAILTGDQPDLVERWRTKAEVAS
jgi:iron complex transport system substrate-binding protein